MDNVMKFKLQFQIAYNMKQHVLVLDVKEILY